MNRGAGPPVDELIERAFRGDVTDAERERLAIWRRESPEHERQFQRTMRLLEATRSMFSAPVSVPDRPAAAAVISRARSRDRLSFAPHLVRWAPWGVAAAAVLVAALNIAGAGEPVPSPPTEVVTGASELATVTLGDGTVVRLAPSSRLLTGAGNREREVMLEGRAFFAVAKNDGEPFTVRTPGASARVLGTRFQLATGRSGVRLQVIEGRVSLEAARNSVEVGAGEESGVREGVATPPEPLAGNSVAGWIGKFLAFQDTPLRSVAREIELIYGERVVVTDSILATATLTATFTDRPLEDVLDVLCSVLDARCDAADGVFTISR
jgi:ferric-dicitrate binding protein FerR (iron transport regulator)